MTSLKQDCQLLKAVEADAKVEEFWAACRALGLISKFVTGPFWRILESETPILEMNVKYQHMVMCFDRWAKDAAQLLSGEAKLFEEYPLHIDAVSDALLRPTLQDSLVQEILEAIKIFSGFSVLFKQMVSNHLSGGEFDVEVTQERKSETASVQKTNTVSERDFAQLDWLLREKPNCTTMSLEAMIMFSNNKTLNTLVKRFLGRLLKNGESC